MTAHGTKAATRLAANTSPEPFSNIALSAMEDAGSVGLSVLAVYHPVVTLAVVAMLVVLGLVMVRKFARELRGMVRYFRL